MFKYDRNAVGPLTMEELQIVLPENVAILLDKKEKACFFERVEILISGAGDPEVLDPVALSYLHPADDWPKLTKRAKRAVLASAILGEAMAFCVYE